MNIETRIVRARSQMLLKHPFWGQLSVRLRPKEASDLIPSAATDGKYFYYNKKWLARQLKAAASGRKDDAMEFVFAHELSHIIHDSFDRLRGRNSTIWNLATDLGINADLQKEFGWVPEGAAYSPQFKDWYHEKIYAHLIENTKVTTQTICYGDNEGNNNSGGDQKQGSGEQDSSPTVTCTKYEVEMPDGETREFEEWDYHMPLHTDMSEETQQEWRNAVIASAQTAKMQGKLPSGIGKLVEEITEPVLPWRALLADFVTEQAREDYNWSRPDPIMMQYDILLPTLHSQKMNVAVAIDTSGSISQEEAEEFLGELTGITGAFPGSEVHTYFCDAAVHYSQTIRDFDELDIDEAFSNGGGGTDFCPVFQAIEDDVVTPGCLIYLTDGYGGYPTMCSTHSCGEPGYPTLWIINNDNYDIDNIPFGRVTRLTNE